MRELVVLAFATTVLVLSSPSAAQSPREQNARSLKPYMAPKAVSELEWELLQFNLLWIRAYSGNADYVTSLPVWFETKTMRFRATFQLQEKRDPTDPEPWSKMSRTERASILQGPIDQLILMLGQSFPEIKTRPALVYAEIWNTNKLGGRFVAATFEDGKLKLHD